MSGYCNPHLNKTDINILGGNRFMKIEDIFKDAPEGKLSLEEFNKIASDGKAKFVDLAEGGYVSQMKHDSEIQSRDEQIKTLNDTISQRDTDIADIKKQLDDASKNDGEKLSEVSTQLSDLQKKYEEDTKSYETKLASQAREFAIKEYAADKKFTSTAAKQFYIESMIKSEDVKFNKKGQLTGMEEFDTDYMANNADSFVVDEPALAPEPTPAPETPKPSFGGSTPGANPQPQKPSLSELMKAKNENPDMVVSF